MDRKAWIVVILCSLGIVWSFLDMNKKQQAALEARLVENPPVTGFSAPSAVHPTDSLGGSTPMAVTGAPRTPEVTHTLKSDRAEFVFSTKTGGLSKIVALTNSGAEGEHLVLNDYAGMAIGTLVLPPTMNGAGIPVRAPEAHVYKITEKDAKHVVLQAQTPEGLVIRKTFTLHGAEGKDPNLLNYALQIENKGAGVANLNGYSLFLGGMGKIRPADVELPNFFWNDGGDASKIDTSSFSGGWFGDPRHEITKSGTKLKWAGVMDRYNAIIVSPAAPGNAVLWSQASEYVIDDKKIPLISGGLVLEDVTLAAGAVKKLDFEIYAGAKEYRRLVNLGDERSKVMFYGWFSWISRLMINLMSIFRGWTQSWGWAIVFMTIAIRLALYPLMAGSQRSMKKMAGMQEEMKGLREKYKDDARRMQMETMALYKKHGVNPVAGCLPIFIQIPVFFGFFAVINHAAELRGEPFLWWVKDLSLPDTVTYLIGIPINPLPIIMAITSFFQIRSMPQTGDPMMRRIMMFMPLMFLFFCYSYGSGLALYWTVGNLFQIVQTYLTTKYGKETGKTVPGVIDVDAQTVTSSTKRTAARPGGAGSIKSPRSKK